MAQYRQFGYRDHDLHHPNGAPDHHPIGIRAAPAAPHHHKPGRHRRFARSEKGRRCSIGALAVVLSLGLAVTALAYYCLSREGRDRNSYRGEEDDLKSDLDFLANVTRTENVKVLGFGRGSVAHGRDSRYWDRDDRRRDEDYSEEAVENTKGTSNNASSDKSRMSTKGKNGSKKSSVDDSRGANRRGVGLYNEAGRNELKMYEAEYEASLKSSGQSIKQTGNKNELSDTGDENEEFDAEDEYDGIDLHDAHDNALSDDSDDSDLTISREVNKKSYQGNGRESSNKFEIGTKGRNVAEVADEVSKKSSKKESDNSLDSLATNSRRKSVSDGRATKKPTKRKSKRRSCEMKLLNSTAQLVEPLESRKFARFALQYVEIEEKPDWQPEWEPRFAGHQTLQQREDSFLARDQKMHCGFVRSPDGFPSTGFDLSEDDASYISRCHIAVSSCIFGNSDRLRTPASKMITRLSRKNVCFVMFVDEVTMQTLTSEGHMVDTMGFIGLWKIVVVKNLPYDDMRRVGKIPKFLSHRLFPSARYSIWLDSKLRLQLDPLLILEYFLWRKGYEYSISNHYDRHCVWEEVAQNKRLNKYNHSIIDQQFTFYQSDGLKRFNPLDPMKLLSSNVPEGSFIVRAHTPMSNLFSCLWFNEIDRFTPRDQLSFAYTYQKLRRMNPEKPFHLNMFKDCERRRVAKLFRHRSDERRNTHQVEID
ncbi:hypothetical protein EUGRSUZ_F02622 [Eucalyptus grandis]|uniref:TOD1/MUCI70 glycosyltransferase-like domain-containing protein n=3 Tax=Eucalyptus grandis TaxID=71139 RepID=A0A059BS31_EUCGR|nr:hypothetical protein EUGRSUZ_F02622 [Eucalyptus grandis]KAK3426094.1 hypothetical protein EUGRSUZ_F02622 [Eucalyptus grandis]